MKKNSVNMKQALLMDISGVLVVRSYIAWVMQTDALRHFFETYSTQKKLFPYIDCLDQTYPNYYFALIRYQQLHSPLYDEEITSFLSKASLDKQFHLKTLQGNSINPLMLQLLLEAQQQSWKICLATHATSHWIQSHVLPDVSVCLDAIFSIDTVPYSKSDISYYQYIADILQLSCSHLYLLDDSLVNIQAARLAGAQTLLYQPWMSLTTLKQSIFN